VTGKHIGVAAEIKEVDPDTKFVSCSRSQVEKIYELYSS
jgi:uncharacterized iron-regulated protein